MSEVRARSRPRRRRQLLVAAIVGAGLASSLAPAGVAAATPTAEEAASLADVVLGAARDAHFEQTIDFGPFEDVCPGARFCTFPAGQVKAMPNVDIAVIELDADGAVVDAANVLLSRDYPQGVAVPVDEAPGAAGTLGTTAVRWRRWDIDRYNGGTYNQSNGKLRSAKGWTDNPAFTAADDIVAGRDGAPLQFMAPYPASLLKLMVAFRVMRLVDAGRLSLDQAVTWDPTVRNDANVDAADLPVHAGGAPAHDTRTQTVRQWMTSMMEYSDNDSGRALIKKLWDLGDLPAMHAEFASLGLGTLQINGTIPETGRNWQPGQIHMTSLDTARLLWLIDGGNGTLWTRPDGQPVQASLLSAISRAFLLELLVDQGYHEALSTTNYCGLANIEPGIPAPLSAKWIAPDGTAVVDGYRYGQPVAPCNDAAEVTFAHKTGVTFNYAADAGIVRSLPGKPQRHYLISVIGSLGYRYTDPVFATRSSYPCYDEVAPICYTQRLPRLARQIDTALAQRAA